MGKIIKKIQRRIEDYYYLVFKYSSAGQLRIQRLEKEDGGEYENDFNSYSSFKKYQKKFRIKLGLFLFIATSLTISLVVIIFLVINILLLFFSSGLSLDEWKASYKEGVMNNGSSGQYLDWETHSGDVFSGEEGGLIKKEDNGKKAEHLISFPKEWTQEGSFYVSPVYEIKVEKNFTHVYIVESADFGGEYFTEMQVATSTQEKMQDVVWGEMCAVHIDPATGSDTLLNSACVDNSDRFLQYRIKKAEFPSEESKKIMIIFSWDKE